MILEIVCDNSLNSILSILKNIFNTIIIVAPILEIIALIILFINMARNPDDKKGLVKIKNSILALFFLFMVPSIINMFMYIIGDNSNITSCWNNANNKIVLSTNYINDNKTKRKSILSKEKDYEKGVPRKGTSENGISSSKNLDYSCKSNKIKAQFSCDNLKIIEKHLHELNANNYYNVINNQYNGSFEEYAKSVGGIYGDYFGKQIKGRTTEDFQRACEYVLGWMYMYGWTYWGSTPSATVFWKNGFYEKYDKSKVHYYSDPPYQGNQNFDNLISARKGINNMASACGELEIFAYDKMGISRAKQLPKVSRLRDLKVGDGIYFFNHKVDKSSEKDWGIGRHNVIVGEVYNDHLVFYDVGGTFPSSGNYKRVVYFPNEQKGETDMDAIRKEYPYYDKNVDWGMRRFYNFESK